MKKYISNYISCKFQLKAHTYTHNISKDYQFESLKLTILFPHPATSRYLQLYGFLIVGYYED